MILLQQMVVLFLVMLVGIIAHKRDIITEESGKKISGIVVYIANPAIIINGVTSRSENISGKSLLMVAVIAICVYACLILIAGFLPYLLNVEKFEFGSYRLMFIFSNIGFMGFPILKATYGDDAVFYATMFVLPFNILIYTYGIAMMGAKKTRDGNKWKQIMNIGVVACIIAIVIFVSRIQLPEFMTDTLGLLSNLTAPLSMLLIGASFASINIVKLFKNIKLLIFSVIKQFIVPVIGTLIVGIFVKDPLILGVIMIVLATPVGSMTAMLAIEYDGDYELASQGIGITTIISLISIPIVSMVIEGIQKLL